MGKRLTWRATDEKEELPMGRVDPGQQGIDVHGGSVRLGGNLRKMMRGEIEEFGSRLDNVSLNAGAALAASQQSTADPITKAYQEYR